MIDRERRNQYAEQLRHFAAGILTVEEYEARTDELVFNSDDPALHMVWDSIWGLYDDIRTDRLRGKWALDANTRRQIARSILFLYTNAEYRWPDDNQPDIIGCLLGGVGTLLYLATLGLCRSAFDPYYARHRNMRERWMRQFGDVECWPFLHKAEFEEALRRPRLFVGKAV